MTAAVASASGLEFEVELRHGAGDRAMAEWRVLEPGDGFARLLGRVDMGHHDAPGSAIQRTRRHIVTAGRDAQERRNTDGVGGHRDLHRRVERHRIVLEIEEQPVEAAGLHRRGDIDRARLAEENADRHLALLQALACGIARRHGSNGSMRTLRVR